MNTLKKLQRVFKRNEGFSLIEIMIVVAIIGILSAIVGPQLFNNINRADVTAAKNQIRNFEVALQNYVLENKVYPSTEEGLQALVAGGYMRTIPKDPWKNDYIYRSPGEGGREFDITSLGKDGRAGGESFDADINSWEL